MKSPNELSARLTRQWQNSELRVTRLLNADAWPVQLPIGFPTAQQFVSQTAAIREHITLWRKVGAGQVIWEEKKYIASSDSLELPKSWLINSPSEWVAATNNKDVIQEFKVLENIISEVDSIFHRLIIRKRNLVIPKPVDEVIHATHISLSLEPGCAQGKPLRALSVENCDSKFFERNQNLITQLLDVRFDNRVSDVGLEQFLNAADESEHWLLLVPLDNQLLPFEQLRIRASELEKNELPASHIIIIENEQCLHQLPKLSNTIAILGAGLNLSWLKATWFNKKILAYWGDMDTWGLTILANARLKQSHLTAILMNQATYDRHSDKFAVIEPRIADELPPSTLTEEEQLFYTALSSSNKGRLEQEFLPESEVNNVFFEWHKASQVFKKLPTGLVK